jgi:PhnB protein
MAMRWKDSPDKSMTTPENTDTVMHSQFQLGDATVMASEGRSIGKPNFNGIMLSILASEAEVERLFAGLAEDGQIQMPLAKTFFAPRVGMVADKFGVGWMVVVAN